MKFWIFRSRRQRRANTANRGVSLLPGRLPRFESLEDRRMLSSGLPAVTSLPAAVAGNNPTAGLTFDAAVQPDQAVLAPHVVVTGNSQAIVNGSTTPSPENDTAFGNTVPGATLIEIYTITNSGTAPLSVGPVLIVGPDAADFTVETQPGNSVAVGGSTTFVVWFTPTTAGTLSATISFTTNDSSQPSPFTFAINGVAVASNAKITVSGGGQVIDSGSTTSSFANGTAFANTVVGNSTYVTYAITNSGTAPFTLGTVSIGGMNPADFTVTKQPNSSVAARGSTTFTVRFTPTTSGSFSATVSFTENASGENAPFTFAISGAATIKQPIINVSGGNEPIANGSTTSNPGNGTAFVATAVGNSASITYAITNSGTAPLTLGTVSISGTNAADFIVTKQPNTSVAVGGSTTFTILFKPTASGSALTATVSFTQNSPIETSPFTFAIGGVATAKQPRLEVTAGGQLIGNQSGAFSPLNGTAFVSTVGGTSAQVTYEISNSGTAPLALGTVSILPLAVSGNGPVSDFIVTKQPSSSVAVGGSTSFTVEFKPVAATAYVYAAVSFSQNDPNQSTNPFAFGILGEASAARPLITVSGGNQPITDGSTTPSSANATSLANTVVGESSQATYTIANSGTGPLTVGTVSISGTNAADFTVIKQPNSSVAVKGSTTFTIQFKPTAVGTPSATVSFTENDLTNPSPFTFAINGTATAAPAVAVSSDIKLASIESVAATPASNEPTAKSPVDYRATVARIVMPSETPATPADVAPVNPAALTNQASTANIRSHGRHDLAAADAAVSDFDLADLYV
jgi:uncharacterized membrane protein